MGSDPTRHQIQPRKHFIQRVTEQPCPQHGPCHSHNTWKAPTDTGDLCSVEVAGLERGRCKTRAQRLCQSGALGDYPWNQTMPHAVEEGRKSWDGSWLILLGRKHCPFPAPAEVSQQPPMPPLLGAIQDASEKKRTQQKMRQGWWHPRGDTLSSSHGTSQRGAGKVPSGVVSSFGTQCEHSSWPGHGDMGPWGQLLQTT